MPVRLLADYFALVKKQNRHHSPLGKFLTKSLFEMQRNTFLVRYEPNVYGVGKIQESKVKVRKHKKNL